MEHLETINLSQFRKGNDTQRAEFCASLFSSFANKGFVKIDNHGLSAEYVAEGFRYVCCFRWHKFKAKLLLTIFLLLESRTLSTAIRYQDDLCSSATA